MKEERTTVIDGEALLEWLMQTDEELFGDDPCYNDDDKEQT